MILSLPSIGALGSLRFGDRFVLDREIYRIRNEAKLMGALVERFGLLD